MLLLRHYIRERLAAYYAQPSNLVIGYYEGESIDFSKLWGEAHFRFRYNKLYKSQKGQWMTPVELFKPYYSYCFADYVANDFLKKDHTSSRIHVIELGAGRGTNANAFMTQWKNKYPELYEKLDFTAVDSSPTLHRHQQTVVGSSTHGHKVNIRLVDLMDVAEKKVELVDKSDVPTYVMALEVLDNLPHDKILWNKSNNTILAAQIRPLDPSRNSTTHDNELQKYFEEVFTDLEDPLLQSILNTVPSVSTPRWIPSVACGVMDHLFQNRENVHLILADFDWLPGEGEPLVTCMEDKDYNCFLQSPYLSDILFPTDFTFLSKYIRARHGRHHVSIMKQGDFLSKFGETHVNATKSFLTGYSPLVGEFANCSVLTTTTTR